MSGVHDVALFVAAGLLLNLTPGPDMAYIAARSASGGFRDGAAAVFGITAGCFVHTLAAALGLSALLATSATAFEIVKWCGALYLFYAGVRLILSHGEPLHNARGRDGPLAGDDRANQDEADGRRHLNSLPSASATRIFREALMINVFNPKVALFFLAFLPQFIAADAPAKALAFVLLGALFNFNSLFVNLPVAWLAARAGTRLRGRGRALQWMQRTTGALFILLAARLAALARD